MRIDEKSSIPFKPTLKYERELKKIWSNPQ